MKLSQGLSGTRLVLLGVVIAGCSETVAVRDNVTPEASLAVSAAARFAVGDGLIDLTSAGAGFADTYFRTATNSNNKASGTFRQVRSSGGFLVDFTGTVTCLALDPVNNRAWVAGTVTANNSTHPSFMTPIHQVGRDVWFRIVDYKGTQADRSTVYGFTGSAGITTSAEYCDVRPWPGPPLDVPDARTFPLSKGGISIAP